MGLARNDAIVAVNTLCREYNLKLSEIGCEIDKLPNRKPPLPVELENELRLKFRVLQKGVRLSVKLDFFVFTFDIYYENTQDDLEYVDIDIKEAATSELPFNWYVENLIYDIANQRGIYDALVDRFDKMPEVLELKRIRCEAQELIKKYSRNYDCDLDIVETLFGQECVDPH